MYIVLVQKEASYGSKYSHNCIEFESIEEAKQYIKDIQELECIEEGTKVSLCEVVESITGLLTLSKGN